ncbi:MULTISPECIES: hypothetical protein [Pseudomonadota]|jgi:hypothetical protein|uniref:Uncharacterized protein n=1 Tax=Ralstonia pickettii OR214 TaxID=1264675 RepID=R0DMF7_RALPI|nr:MULTISPECIES: hypothetical protein [Pseudomonadota]MBE3063081.1 hypothetical protein [Cutibacterium acnes]OYT84275.1 MAG: hypothetical protein CFE46_19835 [Burkholderiales bacterium PBB6]ENZ74758.1 hypothetical protein OR214_05279 [Ralstonia pickettii OR214]MCM3583972.1 hypothetical protein [Ralstonia pickettii]MDR9387302.1 hypothetical protein [Ralstonia sp. 11b]
MTINAVSAEDFDRVARQHCRGWGPDSLSVVRALLVNLERPADVAKKFDKTPQHVNVLKKRFLDKMAKAAAVKVPADQFMLQTPPANASVLEPFKSEITKLVRHGYTDEQIGEFLKANDVDVDAQELVTFLRGNA